MKQSSGFQSKVCGKCGRNYEKESDFLSGTSRWRICTAPDGHHLCFNCSCGASVLLPEGKSDWYDPKRYMSTEAASVFNRLASKMEMPYLSVAIMELQNLLGNPDASPAQLSNSIRKDPALAAEVIGIANNLKAPTGEKITSLEHAVVFVGYKTISELVLIAATKMLRFKTKHFTERIFWKEAMLTGHVAEKIAMEFAPDVSVDEVYLAGTLANMGKAVSAICLPEQTDEVYAAVSAKTAAISWPQAEKRVGGVDHRILGEVAGVLWGFPSYVTETAINHHRLPLLGGPASVLSVVEIASFANQVVHKLLDQETRLDVNILKGYFFRIFKDQTHFESFLEQVRESTSRVRF